MFDNSWFQILKSHCMMTSALGYNEDTAKGQMYSLQYSLECCPNLLYLPRELRIANSFFFFFLPLTARPRTRAGWTLASLLLGSFLSSPHLVLESQNYHFPFREGSGGIVNMSAIPSPEPALHASFPWSLPTRTFKGVGGMPRPRVS